VWSVCFTWRSYKLLLNPRTDVARQVVIWTDLGVRAGNAYFGVANCMRAASHQAPQRQARAESEGDGALSALQLAAMSTDTVNAGGCHKLQSHLLRRLVAPTNAMAMLIAVQTNSSRTRGIVHYAKWLSMNRMYVIQSKRWK
jgi:hypothetical protein